ncbi:MMPL family transporter [Streptomyces echinoruber]|uniref:Membrane protein n=1 Tax=Streptomyces echinoruber TaxID=68898 RepID=A0A918VDX4_9ACTN|nr:MMPL family transporter [Streptomyces echinoruber]GGZ90913.1 membrane protein [Streptomyces echinoruber]
MFRPRGSRKPEPGTPPAGRPGVRAPWLVLLFGLLFVVNAVVVGSDVGGRLHGGGTTDPASASARADALLERHFPTGAPNLVLLVRGSAPGARVDDARVAAQGARLTERLAFEPGVEGVSSYWQTGSPQLRSADRREALVVAHLAGGEDETARVLHRLAPRYRGSPPGAGALEVRIGGTVAVREQIQSTVRDDLRTAELIALPLTLAVLVLVFGSVVAALLPLGVGLVAIAGTDAALRLLTSFTEVSVFAQNLTTALGLGLAIDYALLLVRRFREELETGADPQAAVGRTLRTAGRTVAFSALTVAVSLAAMLVFPLYFLRSFAYAGISVVLLAATAALVLLPAALRLLGRRVDALRLRRRGAARPGRAAAHVVRHPVRYAVAVTALLLVAGAPFLRAEYGTADDRQLPASAEARAVQDAIRTDFAAGATGGVEIVARGGPRLGAYAARLSALESVAEVDTPRGTYRAGRLAAAAGPADAARAADGLNRITVVPRKGVEEFSPRGARLVRQVRKVGADRAFRSLAPLAGGPAAALQDSKHAIAAKLPVAGLVVALATVVLVFLLTGSLLLPLLSVVFGALSLTAMFGLVVRVFQQGDLSGLLGFTPTGTIETTLPVLMFCVAFGLSMDYGVFLLSRIKEEHDRTGDPTAAIVTGMRRTSGLITAAALILSIVFVAIGTSRITNIKMLGLGCAVAVLTDATVVRGLLVPALLRLAGHAAWWAPTPLRRFQERFGLREESAGTPSPLSSDTELEPVR